MLGFNLIMSCRFAISQDIIDYGEYKSLAFCGYQSILVSIGMILCMLIFKVEKEMPEAQKCLAKRRRENEREENM